MPGPTTRPGSGPSGGTGTTWDDVLKRNGWPAFAIPAAKAIIKRESGGNQDACCGKRCKTPQKGACASQPSTDRGGFQINDVAHPDVSDDCAYDPDCAAKAALKIAKGGHDWGPWSSSGGTPAPLRTPLPLTGKGSGNALVGGDSGIPNPLSAVTSVAGGVASLANSLEHLVSGLFSSSTWFRVGKVLVGLILGLAGLVILIRKAGITPPVIPIPV